MSKGYRKRENESFVNRQGERRTRRNESKQSKPFTGFTSPYRRINEQTLLMQKNQTDSVNREKRSFNYRNKSPNNRRGFEPVTASSYPTRTNVLLNRNVDSRFEPTSPAYTGFSKPRIPDHRYKYRGINWRSEHDKGAVNKHRSHSVINPWSDKYVRETMNFVNESKAMKRLNDESVYGCGKVPGEHNLPQEETNYRKNYEGPMDPMEFREQCRRAYVKAAEERHRNAEMSVWGKCDWATYDKYKNSRP